LPKSTAGQTQPQDPAQTCAPPQSARISPALIPYRKVRNGTPHNCLVQP
jgi:hypothetical protein